MKERAFLPQEAVIDGHAPSRRVGHRHAPVSHLRVAFKQLEPGTEVVHGPFSNELRARTEWQRLTFRDRCAATERYSICVEPVLQ